MNHGFLLWPEMALALRPIDLSNGSLIRGDDSRQLRRFKWPFSGVSLMFDAQHGACGERSTFDFED
ncbi:hypothetical protein WCLP8_4120003 [uncultured Gammaproteobacteria bacterium]